MRELTNSSGQNLPAHIVEFAAIVRPGSYTDIVACNSSKILPFAARHGQAALQAIIMGVLSKLSESLGKAISGDQVAESAELIIRRYPDTKLSDFILFKDQMLTGEIGGQVGDQLWQLNTRTIMVAWGEYYEKREDAFCDYREQKHNEAKQEFSTGLARAYANASPESKALIQGTIANMERVANAKRIKAEEAKAVIPQKLSLEEIAKLEGVDMVALAEAIKAKAERRRDEEKLTVPMMLLLQSEMASALYEARQDGKYLHKLINPNQ